MQTLSSKQYNSPLRNDFDIRALIKERVDKESLIEWAQNSPQNKTLPGFKVDRPQWKKTPLKAFISQIML